MISSEIQDEIQSICHKYMGEGRTGRLICPTYGKKKIAKLIGVNYIGMSRIERKRFNVDIICAYQDGIFIQQFQY